MLPAPSRLTDSRAFQRVTRRGKRASSRGLVVHMLAPQDDITSQGGRRVPTRIGFVVSRRVGPAVQRNRVKRRLRHLMRSRLETLPAGSETVVRALPASANMSSADLATGLDRCLATLARLPGRRTGPDAAIPQSESR